MRRLVALFVFASSLVYSASPRAVAPRKYLAPGQEKLQRALRQALPSLQQSLPPLVPHMLPAVDNGELRKNANQDGRVQVGIHRTLEPTALAAARRDGAVWRLAIQSPGASALRLHFTRFAVGGGLVWIHDGGGDAERVLGPYTGRGVNDDGDFWSDTVFSDTVTVEYQAEDGRPAEGEVPFAIAELSHQFSTLASPNPRDSAAASCELDVTCYADWAATATGVARISFETSAGTYVCSGTLLNTRNNSNVPYFLTANHCIDTDAVAKTVQAIWLFQKDSCNGALPNSAFPRSLGASLVVTGDRTQGDFTLIKFSSIPDGVTFQGWDPTEAPVGTPVTVIHHPAGDYKRISFGNVASNSHTPSNFYSVFYSAGLTEGGSSGSGIFSAPGVLVGTLSNGPKADTAEGYCQLIPFADNYGKFSGYYPLLRDILEERGVSGPPTPPPPASGTLTSGVAQTFNLGPVAGGTLFNGSRGFTITVPQGATQLDVVVKTTTPNADLDLFVRFGQDVIVNAGSPVADYSSQGPTGNEQVTITAASNPTLRAGTYYISLALFTPNVAVTGTVTATVTGGSTPPPAPPPSGGGGVLTSGTARSFLLPAVSSGTLFNRGSGFTIDVPQGATRLDVKLSSSMPDVDLDLFVRFGQDPTVANGSVAADYSSTGPTAEESVTVTASSNPPLKAGTYYIAVASFTTGFPISATITATVTTGTAPPPAGGNVLTSGRPQNLTLGPVTGGTLFTGSAGYTVVVPQGATSLDIVLHTITPNVDMDLFARYNQDNTVASGSVVADYSSTGPTGEEHITINASSSPPLRAGTYYISLALFTPNVQATGTLTATVNTGGTTPPPASGPTVLTSGTRQSFSFNAMANATLLTGNLSYVIDVPANATRLDVQLATTTPGADLDLYVSYGKDNSLSNWGVVSDFNSTGPDGNERITITPDSTPSLQPGRYYISLAVYTTGTAVTGTLVATVGSSGGQTPTAPTAPTVLTSGQPAKFSLPAVTGGTLFTGNYSFQIQVPAGATQMRIQVVSDNPAVDVDLYARYQADNAVDGSGSVAADYASEGPTGNESITVGTASSPPLRPGLYYISLALFSKNVVSTGTIVVTVDRGSVTPPGTSGTVLTSGVPATYSLPSVTSPTLFTGDFGYRITVGSQHTGLRVNVRNNPASTDVDLFVRLGQEPAVVNGHVAADFSSTNDGGNEDVAVLGTSLQPGVYYIALALYSTNVAATGTVTVTLSTAAGGSTEVELAPVSGLTLDPKPSREVQQELPDTKEAAADDGVVVKHTTLLKKHEPVKAEVSQ